MFGRWKKVVAAMKRKGPEDEFRSNLHRGGQASKVNLTQEEYVTAVEAVKKLGLHVAGVDILRSDKGPLVMEVNASPGLEGIENVTGKNIAKSIVKYIEKRHLKQQKKKEGLPKEASERLQKRPVLNVLNKTIFCILFSICYMGMFENNEISLSYIFVLLTGRFAEDSTVFLS